MDNFENEIPGLETAEENAGSLPVEAPEMPEPTPVVQESVTEEAPVEEQASVEEETPASEAIPVAETMDQPQVDSRKESPFANSPYVMNHTQAAQMPASAAAVDKAAKPEKKAGVWKKVISLVLILALVISSCAITAEIVNDYWERRMATLENSLDDLEQEMWDQIGRVQNNGTSQSGTASVDGLTPGQVYAMNERSVVLVYSEIRANGQSGYSTGSGFIISEEGYIVTNAHVVDGGSVFMIMTSDSVQHDAVLVGYDTDNDLAVLKIEAEHLDPVTFGSSDLLVVGDQVAAIGNPLGELTSTLTVGYVSAKERYVTTENSASINMMQTDCAINSGNSGGPLFNMKGEVVGITTAKYSGTSNSGASIEGIGFAIPIDDVLGLIDDIIEYGYVRSAYLGVMVTTEKEPHGVYVQSAEPGWCAAKAGIRAGDIIISIGEYDTPTMARLTRAIRSYDPGDTVQIVVRRGDEEVTMTITFDEKPNALAPSNPTEQMPLPEEGNFDEWYEYFRWFFENQGKP